MMLAEDRQRECTEQRPRYRRSRVAVCEIPAAARAGISGRPLELHGGSGARDAQVIVALHGVGANSLALAISGFPALSDRYLGDRLERAGLHALGRVREGLAGLQGLRRRAADFLAAISLDRVQPARQFVRLAHRAMLRAALSRPGGPDGADGNRYRARCRRRRRTRSSPPARRRSPRAATRFGARVAALLGPEGAAGDRGDRQHTLRAHQPARLHAGVKLGFDRRL